MNRRRLFSSDLGDPPAKAPKLDDEFCKRYAAQMDPSKHSCEDRDLLSVSFYEEVKNVPNSYRVHRTKWLTINGHKFNDFWPREGVLRDFLDSCAPFTKVHICVRWNTMDEMKLMKEFLYRLKLSLKRQRRSVTEIYFDGNINYARVVFEQLVDGNQEKISVRLGYAYRMGLKRQLESMSTIWSRLQMCTNLKELDFEGETNGLFDDLAVTALSGKAGLKTLSVEILNPNQNPNDALIGNIGAVASSCPSLVALHCKEGLCIIKKYFEFNSFFTSKLLDALTPETLKRLESYALSGSIHPKYLPQTVALLSIKLPNLRSLCFDIRANCGENALLVIKTFLDARQSNQSNMLEVDFEWYYADHRTIFVEDPVWDSLAMAPDNRCAFVKGTAVVVCGFRDPVEKQKNERQRKKDFGALKEDEYF